MPRIMDRRMLTLVICCFMHLSYGRGLLSIIGRAYPNWPDGIMAKTTPFSIDLFDKYSF